MSNEIGANLSIPCDKMSGSFDDPMGDYINHKTNPLLSNITLHICRRAEYIEAWKVMYDLDHDKWNDPMFDGINPMLNKKPLDTEIDDRCVVAYDASVLTVPNVGKPIGLFSMVVTKNVRYEIEFPEGRYDPDLCKAIGKQFVVDPVYQGKGIGKAMVVLMEKWLKEKGFSKYYIGCSHMSAGIMKKFGSEPYSSDDRHDLYKFNIDLNRNGFEEQYKNSINGFTIIYDN